MVSVGSLPFIPIFHQNLPSNPVAVQIWTLRVDHVGHVSHFGQVDHVSYVGQVCLVGHVGHKP